MSTNVTAVEEQPIILEQIPLNSATNKQTKTNYHFVDLIRFLSMMGIVWAHINVSDMLSTENLKTTDHSFAVILFMQFWKFGVICFFIISGFLLADTDRLNNTKIYYQKRVKTLLKPYTIALSIFLILDLLIHPFFEKTTLTGHFILNKLYLLLTQSAFWFVPNYIIALSTILLFRKYVPSIKFGVTLLAITLVYSVLTVYTSQYQASHTTAFLGFVFYLWLGVYFNKNKILDKIKSMRSAVLILTAISLFILSSIESFFLFRLNLSFFSILRIGNQLYSLSIFALLVNLSSKIPPFKFFNPRKETYGIYLYHCFFVIVPKRFYTLLHIKLPYNHTFECMGHAIIWFAICYLGTTILVKTLNHFKLGYLPS
jgi:peptidoglycan/LPS O-acetylase OafA/YrhL